MLYNIYYENALGGRGGLTAIEEVLVKKLAEAFLRGGNEVKHNGESFRFGTSCFHIYEIPSNQGNDPKELIKVFDQYENQCYRGNFQEEVFSDICKDVTSEFLKGFEQGELVDYFNIYVTHGESKSYITVLNRNEVVDFLDSWTRGENPIWVDNRSIPFNGPKSIKIFDIKFEYLSKHGGDIKEFQRRTIRLLFKNEWRIDALEYLGKDVSKDWEIKPFGGSTKARPDMLERKFDWSDIHPEIARVSKGRFVSPHYADSVEAAFKEINDLVKKEFLKISNEELDGVKLIRTAFSHLNPKIRLTENVSESEKNIQEGYMNIFAGAMIGIRNPKTHANIVIDEKDAWEKIVLASHLMKMFDRRIKADEKSTQTT